MSLAKLIRNIKKNEALIITPRIEKWLMEHPEGVVLDDETRPVIMDLLSMRENQDRANRFGASSRGTCERSQVLAFLGVPQMRRVNPDLQNLFNDGTWRHVRWQAMGLLSGVLTHVEVPVVFEKYNLKVSIDGLNEDERFLFELKGSSHWTNTLDGISDRHNLQMHTMMLATGYDVCVYVVEDKRTQSWREVVVRKDPEVMKFVKSELRFLNDCLELRQLPDILPDCALRTGSVYKGCAWARECLSMNGWPNGSDS